MTTRVEHRIHQVARDQASHRDCHNDPDPRPHLLHTVIGCTTGSVDLAPALHRGDTKARITSHSSAARWFHAAGVPAEPRPPATNPSSASPRRSSRPAASPSATVVPASRITRTQQSDPGLQTPLDLRCVRHHVTAGFRLAGTVNGKTGAHARILEADLALPAYPIRHLVGDLPDPVSPARPCVPASGASSDPYKRIGPREYFERLAGIVVPRDGLVHCPAHEDRVPSCSVGTDASQGWRCHAGGCGARGAIYDLASVLLGGPWGPQLRGEAFKRARAYVIDAFGEPIGDHDGTASGRPGERSTR